LLQDYVDMFDSLRSLDPKNDIINRPGKTEGCWVWRCHLSLEKLLAAADFNALVQKMLTEAGRGKTY
jgi:4-alpha-glucanotransferase